MQDIREGPPAIDEASRAPGIKSLCPYLLSHGSDAPVLRLSTGGRGWGRHPHLAAFPAKALSATVEATQKILGRSTAVVQWVQLYGSWECLGPHIVTVCGIRYWSYNLVLTLCKILTSPRRRQSPEAYLRRHQGAEAGWRCSGLSSRQLTFTGLSVAEKASCRAQQASRHISSVNTGPAVTRTYLPGETRKT